MLRKLAAAVGLAPKKRSSPEMSSLAARILSYQQQDREPGNEGLCDRYNALLTDAKSLAGSVLSQDELK